LDEFHAMVSAGERDPAVINKFPVKELLKVISSPWRTPGVQLYANWLLEVRRRVGSRVQVG